MGKWFSSYPLLRSISGTLFILLVLQTAAVSLLIYTIFSNQIREEKYYSFAEGASLADGITESFFSEVTRLSAHLATNEPDITAAMFQRSEDPVADFTAVTRLGKMQLSYDYISYSAFYRQSDDKLRSTVGIGRDSQREMKDFVRDHYETGKPTQFTAADIQAADKRGYPSVYPTITFVAYSNLSKKDHMGAVLVGVDTAYFQQMYANIESSQYAPFALIDDEGHAFSMPDREVYENTGIHRKIKESEKLNGYFTEWVDGSQYIISYSRNTNLGCFLFQAVPYNLVFADLFNMQVKTFMWTLLFLCIGTALSYFLAYRLLLPLYGLLRKYNYKPHIRGGGSEVSFLDNEFVRLTAGTEKSRELMCHMALYDLLLNQPVNDAAVLKDISPLPFCLVVLLSIDREASVKTVSVEESSAVRYAVCDIASKTLKKNFSRMDTVIMNSADVAVIIFLEDGRVPGKLKSSLLESRELIQAIYGANVFCAVSSVAGSIYELNDSYNEAAALMERNFLFGKPVVFAGGDLPEPRDILFPSALEKELFAAVSGINHDEIRRVLAEFFSCISAASYECAAAYISRLVTDLAHYCQGVLSQPVTVDDVLTFIHKARSVKQVENRVAMLCGELCEGFTKPSGFSQAVEISLELTEKNYADEAFSINSVAGQLNITASYFNRVFKKEYGISYSEHLNLVRLKNARDLLTETGLSIADICTKSGFSNISYFYTLFKKKYGMTPIEYRSNNE